VRLPLLLLVAALALPSVKGDDLTGSPGTAPDEMTGTDHPIGSLSSSSWTSSTLSTTSPVGSCVRCGRDVWWTFANQNAEITIERRDHKQVFKGCETCLYEWLALAPRFAPPKVPSPQ